MEGLVTYSSIIYLTSRKEAPGLVLEQKEKDFPGI